MAERKRVAPYAPASAVSEFFDHIRYVKTPKKVDSSLLLDYGISQSQAFPVLSTLRFLEIVEPDGTPTPAFRALQTGGDEFQTALRELVERSYSELFSRLDVSRDSKDKIKNFFARNYSPATAERATTLFLDLCGEAGIPTTAAKSEREPTQKRASQPHQRRQSTKGIEGVVVRPEPVAINISDDDRTVLEIRLTDRDMSVMSSAEIDEVFAAAAKIQKARAKSLAQLLGGNGKESQG